MKLYTRTGDDGTTSLFDGTRVAKDHLRVAGYGDVDELNAAVGLVISAIRDLRGDAGKLAEMDQQLAEIQSELFVVGSDLATPGEAKVRARVPTVTAAQVARLEAWIDAATEPVPVLKNFSRASLVLSSRTISWFRRWTITVGVRAGKNAPSAEATS